MSKDILGLIGMGMAVMVVLTVELCDIIKNKSSCE